MIKFKKLILINLLFFLILVSTKSLADNHNILEIIELIQKDLKTLERAVYSETLNESSSNTKTNTNNSFDQNSEEVLTRHLLKLSEIESQFQKLTNKFEEINFKLDKLSNRLSKVQADNQLRFQDLESGNIVSSDSNKKITSSKKTQDDKLLPGSSQPQDLGSISYKDSETNLESQETQSIDTVGTILTETFVSEEKLLPNVKPEKQYEFATSFLKVGDYNTAERAFREFVITNPKHKLAGNAQYWYAETFRIRQLFTDAASAYLEGYQKYPKSEKAPINLLKLGVFISTNRRKGSRMLNDNWSKKRIPKSEINLFFKKQNMKKKSLNVKKKNPKKIISYLNNKSITKVYSEFKKSLNTNENYAVAVSGGPDSIALAYLAKCFSIFNKNKFYYFIVNHNLRKDSLIEAKKVILLLKKFQIKCKILNWKGKKPTSNIQSIARNKRFNLLIDECKKNKIDNLLLGHQIDDLYENFILRLLRGSGLRGLTSLDKVSSR